MIAAVADGSAFRKRRDFSAWLGLVPRQSCTGGRTRLDAITKRGNSHPRRMFIHGARSFRLNGNRCDHDLGAWLEALDRRCHRNVATVVLASKLAGIARSVLANGGEHAGHAGTGRAGCGDDTACGTAERKAL